MHAEGRVNRLARESSPYLLLHARNPVDWYPWGEEAFTRARTEDRPIFLSVGYSTCYWCHVMERECFSDPEIAHALNEGFVSIKVDREERPDLDEIYMSATQLMTRSGGWPNSVFLTHELKPFFAGTYFPPRDAMGRPGFPRVLAALREAWALRRPEILSQAEAVGEAMREQLAAGASTAGAPEAGLGDALVAALARRFDRRFGGFGHAPKFPSPSNLAFLLGRAKGGDGQAREMLVVTLDRMARGGLNDQLAGGFHRYSTDEAWLVPHFEKMLYDNAALAPLYAEAAPLAPGLGFERVARTTLDFLLGELRADEGGLLSAIDAETDGHEGAYYTWTKAELDAHLAEADPGLFAAVYGTDGGPNFEGDRYVLSLPLPLAEAAAQRGLTPEALLERLAPGRAALLRARAARPRPLVDDKVLTDWNGLAISGLARTGAALGEPSYVDAAVRAARFALGHRGTGASPGLLHVHRGSVSRLAAFLDDYAFLIEGLLALEAATGDEAWLHEAVRLQAEQDARLLDEDGGGYFSAAEDPRLLFRSKPGYDGAMSSGNGVAARNLLALLRRTGDERYRDEASEVLSAFGGAMNAAPLAHVTLVHAFEGLEEAPPRAASGRPPGRPSPAPSPIDDLEDTAREVVSIDARLAPGVEGWREFTLDLTVKPGWHIQPHQPSEPSLVPTAVHAVLGRVRDVRYPGAEAVDAGRGPSAVYRGRIRVTGAIEAPSAGAPSLELTYQACDEGRCLPPVTRLVRFS
ncbi:MAG TPA: DUF255 domain-containing protein [Vicinamibacteria bacterium]|nr:DUF255 domain-containing protein [Vicinamibacteria bacterium]